MTTISPTRPVRRVEETPTKTSLAFAAICIGSCAITFAVGFATIVWAAVRAVAHLHVTWVP